MQQPFIVSTQQKALVLNPAVPEMLTNLLPMAKPFSYHGHTLYAVPHDVDVVRLLRNVGVSAPSPILYQYDWPCSFPKGPFPSQKEAAAFMTLNPRSFNLSQMGCVDANTEYLTPTGWKRIDQYDGGAVGQYHPATGAVEFVEPTEYVKLPCTDMIRVSGPGVDQLLSPEHRVLVYSNVGWWHEVVEAESLEWVQRVTDSMCLPTGDDYKGRVPLNDCTITYEGSPDGFKYCFMVPSTFLVFRRNGCVFASGNTGKSVSTLWAFDYLRSIGQRHRMLVIAPLSTLERTWGDEIFKHFPHLSFTVLHGTRERRLKLLAHPFDVYIVNHDGLEVIAPGLYKETKVGKTTNIEQLRPDIDVVAVDEIAVLRNSNTDRFKATEKICRPLERIVWGLTGTPIPNEPTDAWAQIRLVDPTRVPKYFGRFREMTMLKVSTYKYIPRNDALEIVQKAMQPAIRFTREALPDTTYVTRHIELTAQQRQMYDDVRLRMKAQAEEGTVRAVHEADKLMKLVQVAAGAVYTTDGEVATLDNRGRLAEVIDTIEQSEGKVIVFVPFIAALHNLREELARHYPTEMVYGGTSKNDRDTAFWRFQNLPSSESRVLVANAAAMSHGLTLTEASTIVWWAPTTSHETFDQSNHRIIRTGQKRKTLIVMFEGTAVERNIYTRLQQRQTTQGLLLEAVNKTAD